MARYEELLAKEAELWGDEAERMAQIVEPRWHAHRKLRHNHVLHAPYIDALLDHVRPGMVTLELGCASGWLTLALAERGAQATGLDISEKSLAVARTYYERVAESVAGTVEYRVADLNYLDLPANTYDLIVVKGTLHHLVNMTDVIDTIHAALKPGGLFWIHDTVDDEHPRTVLFASGLMFLLPTHVSYGDKMRGLLKFGANAPERIKASMQAEGLSPFEGMGRDHDWLSLVRERFSIDREQALPAVTGYITAQLKLPDVLALPLLKLLKQVDFMLVRIGVLRPSARVVYARKW